MPKTNGDTKTELLCTRVTSTIRQAIEHEARLEGLTPSEWIRSVIVKDLKERKALPAIFKLPKLGA